MIHYPLSVFTEGGRKETTPQLCLHMEWSVQCVSVRLCVCVCDIATDTTVYKTNPSSYGAHMFVEENKQD